MVDGGDQITSSYVFRLWIIVVVFVDFWRDTQAGSVCVYRKCFIAVPLKLLTNTLHLPAFSEITTKPLSCSVASIESICVRCVFVYVHSRAFSAHSLLHLWPHLQYDMRCIGVRVKTALIVFLVVCNIFFFLLVFVPSR